MIMKALVLEYLHLMLLCTFLRLNMFVLLNYIHLTTVVKYKMFINQ